MYLSSKHQSTGDLGGMRYPNSNTLLLKNLPLCTCKYPFYSAYNSLNHLLILANLSFALISRRIQDLQFMQMLIKQFMLHTVKETLQYLALNYNSFILTVPIIGVGIYSIEAGGYNVFDSHARDF